MAQSQNTILITIATAFNHLKDNVHSALLTQLGDTAQLEQRIQACSRLSLQINQVKLPNSYFHAKEVADIIGLACQYHT